MTEPVCSHLNIRFTPKSLKNHSYQERWVCVACDCEFLPKSQLPSILADAQQERDAHWQRVVSEGLYTKDGWTDEAIREATK